MRRDNLDGEDYLKLAEDCVYYAWQNEKITNEEYKKTCRETGLAEKRTNYIRKKIAYYSDMLKHRWVFATERMICEAVIQRLKELLNE